MLPEELKDLIVGKTFCVDRNEEVTYHFEENTISIAINKLDKGQSSYSIIEEDGRNYLVTHFTLLNFPPLIVSVLIHHPMIIQLVNPNTLIIHAFLIEKITQK